MTGRSEPSRVPPNATSVDSRSTSPASDGGCTLWHRATHTIRSACSRRGARVFNLGVDLARFRKLITHATAMVSSTRREGIDDSTLVSQLRPADATISLGGRGIGRRFEAALSPTVLSPRNARWVPEIRFTCPRHGRIQSCHARWGAARRESPAVPSTRRDSSSTWVWST